MYVTSSIASSVKTNQSSSPSPSPFQSILSENDDLLLSYKQLLRFMAAYDYCKSCVIGITAALCIYTLILVLLELNEKRSIQNESTVTTGFSIQQIPRNESIIYKQHLLLKNVSRSTVIPRLRTVR